jgi:hypothetical protein
VIHVHLLDVGLGDILMILLMYGIGALVVCLLVVLLEAVVLWLMDWNSFLWSFIDSFLANLSTTILGLFFEPMTLSSGYINEPGFIPRFVLFWGLSVLIEGGLLYILRRQSLGKTFSASCMMNIASYILLFILCLALFK